MSKIQSESNSQLLLKEAVSWMCCGSDVKDTIWKQFTTGSAVGIVPASLWFRCQRYNLKAIHNDSSQATKTLIVVVPMSKIQSESNSQQIEQGQPSKYCCGSDVKDTIWKQFTTNLELHSDWSPLWFRCQRYNLKAIHNTDHRRLYRTFVVVPMSKIQSESNSQQAVVITFSFSCCGSDVKDTIWKQFTTEAFSAFINTKLWFRCQRYNLKAIHNLAWRLRRPSFVVVPMSKIQSESNSQHLAAIHINGVCCGSDVKDTIWKQFTTTAVVSIFWAMLWFRCQRYNLKAIHNWRRHT